MSMVANISLQEAVEKRVKVEVADALTLQHALTYLYTGSYDDVSITDGWRGFEGPKVLNAHECVMDSDLLH